MLAERNTRYADGTRVNYSRRPKRGKVTIVEKAGGNAENRKVREAFKKYGIVPADQLPILGLDEDKKDEKEGEEK